MDEEKARATKWCIDSVTGSVRRCTDPKEDGPRSLVRELPVLGSVRDRFPFMGVAQDTTCPYMLFLLFPSQKWVHYFENSPSLIPMLVGLKQFCLGLLFGQFLGLRVRNLSFL